LKVVLVLERNIALEADPEITSPITSHASREVIESYLGGCFRARAGLHMGAGFPAHHFDCFTTLSFC